MVLLPPIFHKLSPYKLFLIDSSGALLTAFLSLFLTKFENIFGIPAKSLYYLSFLGGIFFIYSFTCFLGKVINWAFYLKIIAIANFFYCCLTISLIIYLYQQLTILGLIYFVLEVIIIIVLATIELKIAYNPIERSKTHFPK